METVRLYKYYFTYYAADAIYGMDVFSVTNIYIALKFLRQCIETTVGVKLDTSILKTTVFCSPSSMGSDLFPKIRKKKTN